MEFERKKLEDQAKGRLTYIQQAIVSKRDTNQRMKEDIVRMQREVEDVKTEIA